MRNAIRHVLPEGYERLDELFDLVKAGMSTAKSTLAIRGIDVEIACKDIKNLHIGVYPPAGRVRVAAPRRLGEDRIRLALIQRLPWIKEQQRQFHDAARQAEPEMVSGESHYAWGIRRRLNVIARPGRAHVELDHRRLLLYVPEGTDAEARAKALRRWQRDELRRAVPPLIARWEKETGRQVAFWGIRRMKAKGGSCNREAARIWLNLELAKKAPACLEYVVVHEMAHLLERGHGERFTKLAPAPQPGRLGFQETVAASHRRCVPARAQMVTRRVLPCRCWFGSLGLSGAVPVRSAALDVG